MSSVGASDGTLRAWQRSAVLNAVSAVVVSYGLYSCTSIKLPPSLEKAGHKQFLTNISAAVTVLNNVSNLANYALRRGGAPSGAVEFWARHVTLPIALAVESVVASVYWPLRLFAIHLIMVDAPRGDRSPIPLQVDLAIHLAPIVLLLSDHYLSGAGAKFRISKRYAWAIVMVLGFGYKSLLGRLIDPDAGQAFPYPFLNVAEPLRSIIFAIVTSISLLYYLAYQRIPPRSGPKSVKRQ